LLKFALRRRFPFRVDLATTDLVLAILHHLLVFMLAGVLAFEIGTVSLTTKRDESSASAALISGRAKRHRKWAETLNRLSDETLTSFLKQILGWSASN
jgi:hypothetical protein